MIEIINEAAEKVSPLEGSTVVEDESDDEEDIESDNDD